MIPSRLREPLRSWGPWAFLLLPIGILASSTWAVTANFSPALYYDQWVTAPLWRGVVEGSATARDFFAQHNEHRIFFPRLVFMADFAWFEGRNVLNLTVIGVIQLAAAALYLTACDLRRPAPLTLLAASTATALMFSLMQWENFFWGFQVQFVGVFAAGGWAIWLFCRSISDPARVAWPSMLAALGLLAVATFSLANGLLAGFAMILVGLTARSRPVALLPVALITAALLAAYLRGYHAVDGHSPTSLALEHPAKYLGYVLIYLGNPWRAGHVELALAAGLAGAVATLAMTVLVFRDGGRDRRRTAMFGIVLFIGMTAAVTALGRLSFGVEQALSSRYVTPANHFWAAQAVFWALTAQAHPGIKRWIGAAIVGAGLILIPFQRHAGDQLAATHERTLPGVAALLAGIDDLDAIRTLYPDPSIPLQMAPFLREQKLSLFAGAPDERVGSRFARASAGQCDGAVDILEPAPQTPTAGRVHGWGRDADGRPFDHLVLTDQAGTVIGQGVGGVRRYGGRLGWVGVYAKGAALQVVAYGIGRDGKACELGRKPTDQSASRPPIAP